MRCNISKNDKNIRLALGTLIVLWGLFYQNWWGLIGLLLLVTAFISWCPLYALLGISTCKHDKQRKEEETSMDKSEEQSLMKKSVTEKNKKEEKELEEGKQENVGGQFGDQGESSGTSEEKKIE